MEKELVQVRTPEDASGGRLPLMMHFSRVLPTEPEDGATANDSGGTTGDPRMGEDANIDYDD
ncbi:MAG: hypothetical protein AAB584_02060 [Patescibacteria group bacterium]